MHEQVCIRICLLHGSRVAREQDTLRHAEGVDQALQRKALAALSVNDEIPIGAGTCDTRKCSNGNLEEYVDLRVLSSA